ncbi:MAG: enoyl-CoA hydratase [Gammaproteobacteria bacterium]
MSANLSSAESSTAASPTDTGAREPVLLRADAGGVVRLTLNRPRQYNALNDDLLAALQRELDAIAGDDAVRVVVIAAAGEAFCPGHDLKEMRAAHSQAQHEDLFARCSRMMRSIVELPKPVIARVQGMATAAGCQLVATCDLAVASTQATFAVSGVNLGLFCSTPSVALSRNVTRKRAFEMLVTGEFIDAGRAVEYGLVNRAVPPQRLDAEVDSLCRVILSKPQIAIETGKRVFYRQLERDLKDAYTLTGEAMACNMMAPDTVEGVDAFLQKRPPKW